MHKILKFTARFFAAILAILFVPSAVLAMVLTSIRLNIFSPSLYKNALTDLSIYERFPTISAGLIFQTPAFSDLAEAGFPAPPFVQKIPAEDLIAILEKIYPSVEIQKMIESILDEFFVFLQGEANQIVFSLETLKKPLAGSSIDETLQNLVDSQPDCTPDEISAITSALPAEMIPVCKPPDELRNLLLSYLRHQMESAVELIPDEYLLSFSSASVSASTESTSFGIDPLADIRLIIDLLIWIPFLPLIFLLGIAALVVRSVKSGLRWLGIPLFISSLLTLGLEQLFRITASTALATALDLMNSAYLTPGLVTLIRDIGEYIVRHLTDWIFYPSLVLLLIGLIAWVASFFIKAKNKPSVALPPGKCMEAP